MPFLKYHFFAFLLVSLCFLESAFSQNKDDLLRIQTIVNNSGFYLKEVDGVWGNKTKTALLEYFEANRIDHDLSLSDARSINFAEILKLITQQIAKNRDTFPAKQIPNTYFAGIGAQWFVNIHNWNNRAIFQKDGRNEYVAKNRFFELTDSDIETFQQSGISVTREQLNMDAALFWDECQYKSERDFETHNTCYDNAYAKATSEIWAKQTHDLNRISDNPVIKLYLDAVEYLNNKEMHVIIAPSDFFWGTGSNWIKSNDIPLLHQYIERDPNFADFYVKWIGAFIGEVRRRGITNISLQSLNEPRWCRDFKSRTIGLGKWQKLERRIFDSARKESPNLSLISSAICTAGDRYFSSNNSYSTGLKTVVPKHNLENIVYAIHMRNPRLLHISYNMNLVDGTVVHYPWKKLSKAAGKNQSTKFAIEMYNATKPNAEFHHRIFKEIAKFSKLNGIKMMVTEWSTGKPEFGILQKDRVALFEDILTTSKANNVSMIYNGLFTQDGLANFPHSLSNPDHRFDPDLLDTFSKANR